MEEQLIDFQQENDEITINLKNIFLALWSRRFFIIKIFSIVLAFFIALTFVLPQKWKVEADLYINKTNNSNFMEINPYALEDVGKIGSVLGGTDPLADELELIQSPLVIDKVIKENNLRYRKMYGIIPTKKTGQYLTTGAFLKKGPEFESKKGTHVLSISYTCKKKDLAYNVVNSIIKNYIILHKEVNSRKSKSDKSIIESEYKKAKAELNKNVNTAGGLPTQSLAGTGNLAAMSTFSRTAQSAIGNIKGQYVAGEKSRIAVGESAAKVSQLAQKLEWANLVDEMSDSSKVIVIKKPHPLRDWEYASPKLFINILLGIVFGIIFSIIGVIYKEITDKKLSYSMLGSDVIYDLKNDYIKFMTELVANSDKKILFTQFENLPAKYTEELKKYPNIRYTNADISMEFKNSVKNTDFVVLLASINKTNAENYKSVKRIIEKTNKTILYEVLV